MKIAQIFKFHMLKNCFLMVLLFNQIAISQTKITGIILDKNTKMPVEYVNLGVVERGIGTVTNTFGKFSITIPVDVPENEKIAFSMIGYKTQIYNIAEMKKKENDTIYLEEEIYTIKEVTIIGKKTSVKPLGSASKSKHIVALFNTTNALGGEVGTKIKLEKPCQLEDFRFHIVYNDFESLTFRINIYSIVNNMPGVNLLKDNIVFNVAPKNTDVVVELHKYNITMNENFIVSIELLDVKGKSDGKLNISAAIGGDTFLRSTSHDKWKHVKNVKLGFNMIPTYY